jgi:hypothetical protein
MRIASNFVECGDTIKKRAGWLVSLWFPGGISRDAGAYGTYLGYSATLGDSAYARLGGLALIFGRVFVYHRDMIAGRRPLFILDQDCQLLTNQIVQEVEKAGLHALRSFDLDAIRASRNGFCCPTHGTSVCTCQLVILLILRRERGALTVILESGGQQTSVYFDSDQGVGEDPVDPSLTIALMHAFFPEKYRYQRKAV